MRFNLIAFTAHRWLAYAVGIQVLIWVIGGLTFAFLPFQDWVKSGASVRRPVVEFPLAALASIAKHDGSAVQFKAFSGPHGPALAVKSAAGSRCFDSRGDLLPAPTATQIAELARALYIGTGRLGAVEQIAASTRLLIVNETGGRDHLWRASFDDALGTRLYFTPDCGEFLHASNDVWVLYDFLWRLHIMDYRGGENFNNPLLRIFATAALVLALSGSLLVILALRRTWRRRRA